MRKLALVTGLMLLAAPAQISLVWAAPAHIEAAVKDAGRPPADTSRDDLRKPAELLEFAGVRPGMVVADLLPGGGYFTRIFSKTVGAKGKVYAVVSDASVAKNPKAADAIIKASRAETAKSAAKKR